MNIHLADCSDGSHCIRRRTPLARKADQLLYVACSIDASSRRPCDTYPMRLLRADTMKDVRPRSYHHETFAQHKEMVLDSMKVGGKAILFLTLSRLGIFENQ
jgi:hypothetical protein